MTPGLLHRARMALGLSQQELADRLGVKKETVYRWEKGRMAFGSPDRLRDELLAMLDERGIEIERLRQEMDRAAYQQGEKTMWTTSNTVGFTQAELDTINAVLERIKADSDGLEESSLNDAINNEWREGISEDELYEATAKRLGVTC